MGSDPQTDILVSHGTANLWLKQPTLLHQGCSIRAALFPSASGLPVPRLKPRGFITALLTPDHAFHHQRASSD